MKKSRVIVASVLAAGVVAAVGVALLLPDDETHVDKTQVAAVVNGSEIMESRVQSYISGVRSRGAGLSSDEAWDRWLQQSGYTQQSYRIYVLDSFIRDELIREKSSELGILVDEEQIDAQVEANKANYDSEESWQRVLRNSGYTEAEYRDAVELSALSKELKESQVHRPVPSREQVQSYYNLHAAQYEGKRSSAILFSPSDAELAAQVLGEILSSENPASAFAAAAMEYSIDAATAKNGGDMGWDSLNVLSSEYEMQLKKLKIGEISPSPVQTDFGFYLIMCSGEFTPLSNATGVIVESVPQEIAAVLNSALESELYSRAFEDYLQSLRDSADVTIYNSDGTIYNPQAQLSENAKSAESAQADAAKSDASKNAAAASVKAETTSQAVAAADAA